MKKTIYLYVILVCFCACQNNPKDDYQYYVSNYPFYNNTSCLSLKKWHIDKINSFIPDSLLEKEDIAYIHGQECLDDGRGIQLWHTCYSYYPKHNRYCTMDISSIYFLSNSTDSTKNYIIQKMTDLSIQDSVCHFLDFLKRNKLNKDVPTLIDKFYCPKDEAFFCNEINRALMAKIGFPQSEEIDLKGKTLWLYRVSDSCMDEKPTVEYPAGKGPNLPTSYLVTFILANEDFSTYIVKTGQYNWTLLLNLLRLSKCKSLRPYQK